MKGQACMPCAKRKVRCDKEEPCSNCKRRKQDHCTYAEPSPFDRIERLEALVRSLGGNPNSDDPLSNIISGNQTEEAGPSPSPAISRALPQSGRPETASYTEGRSADSVVLEEDGQQFYLESRAWQGWLGSGQVDSAKSGAAARSPFLMRRNPHAFEAIFCSKDTIDLAARHPSRQDATTLWNTFHYRVNPVVRISFTWALKRLHPDSVDFGVHKHIADADHAFIFSLYLISVISLSDEDCRREMQQPRSVLIHRYQELCEEALSRTNLLCTANITALKALAMYLMAGIDRLSTQSLWSLMGLIIRNAEKLGLHRDGALLGLSPVDTEERRRLWWQLQHLDLILAVRSGLTPLTLMAGWDAKLPLNIEDDDISASMTDFPKERTGLTSMSYCLCIYYVIDQQRRFFRSEKGWFELSWQTNQLLPQALKDSFTNQLEDGLNKEFLLYCDPIKPVDTLLQLLARALICGFRRRSLYALMNSGNVNSTDNEHRSEHLAACMRSLEYNVAFDSQSSLRHFRWLTQGFFDWHAFMCVLVEVSQQNDITKTQRMWDLLSDMYSANSSLSQLSEDRRRPQAAELVVSAWKARQSQVYSNSGQKLPKPEFVAHLETQLTEWRSTGSGHNFSGTGVVPQRSAGQRVEPVTPDSLLAEQDMNAVFDLDFQDIDWSFWSSVD